MRLPRRLMALAGPILALACLPASARGPQDARTYLSGNDLWTECSATDGYNLGFCLGFVVGIADAMQGTSAGLSSGRVCIPSQVTGEQALDVVVKRYLAQHPEGRHYTAASITTDALAAAFPCKR